MGKPINEVYVTAKYDYVAQGPEELNLRRDERLLLLDGTKQWWKVVNLENQVGYVPMNYVKKEKTSLLENIKKSFSKNGQLNTKTLPRSLISSTASQPNSPMMRRHAPLTFQHSFHGSVNNSPQHLSDKEEESWAYVKYNYEAQQPDELSLLKGTRVLVLEKSGDGWWRGRFENKIGWFPSNYTTCEPPRSNASTSSYSAAYGFSSGEHMYSLAENIVEVVVALHSFAAKNNEELSFVKGERLEILDRPPADPEWSRGRNAKGLIGLIPKNYVQEINAFLQRSSTAQTQAPANHSIESASRSLEALSLATTSLPNANVSSLPLVQDRDWFFGTITRAEADVLLMQYGQEGDFLVRVSESSAGGFSVSLKALGRNKHFRINFEGGLYLIGQRKFTSMDQLVEHYKRYPIFTSEKGERLFLLRPLVKPSSAPAPLPEASQCVQPNA